MKKNFLKRLISMLLISTLIISNTTMIKALNDTTNIASTTNGYVYEENLILNPSFEEITETKTGIWSGRKFPKSWNASSFSSAYKSANISLDNTIKYQGENSIKISSVEANTRSFVHQTFMVAPNTIYELSSFIKTENLAPLMFGIQVLQYKDSSIIDSDANRTTFLRVDGTKDFKEYKHLFRTGATTNKINIRINMGTNQGVKAGSKAWVDGLSFRKVTIPVEGVLLSSEALKGAKGTTLKLTANTIPEMASNKNFIWTSKDENIATVSSLGEVTLNNVGITEIKVTSQEGGFEKVCSIEVIEKIKIDSIDLDKDQDLEFGSFIKLKPKTNPKVDNINFTYTSSDPTVATVNEAGIVTPVKKGTTVIKAQYDDKIAEMNVKVVDKLTTLLPNSGFEAAKDGVPTGYTFNIQAGKGTALLDGENPYRNANSAKVSLLEENTAVTLSTLDRKALSDGIYLVSVMAKSSDFSGEGISFRFNQNKADNVFINSYSPIFKVNNSDSYEKLEFIYDGTHGVRDVDLDILIKGKGTVLLDELKFIKLNGPTSIVVPQTLNYDLSQGPIEEQIKATVDPGTAITDNRLVFESADSSIIAITKEGLATPKKKGKTFIKVMTPYGLVKNQIEVNVTGTLPSSSITNIANVDVPVNIEIKAGRAYKIEPKIEPSTATYKNLTWTSSDENVASVVEGRIFGKTQGTATITLETENNIKNTIKVTVTSDTEDKVEKAINEWGKKVSYTTTNEQLIQDATKLFQTMYKDKGRLYLWDGLENLRLSNIVNKSAGNLRLMALATTIEGSPLYKNEELINATVEGLNWLYKEGYNKELLSNYKFWDWEIGLTKNFSDILAMLYPYMSKAEVENPSKFITNSVTPDVLKSRVATVGEVTAMTGANLVDSIKGIFIPHLILKEQDKLDYAIGALFSTLDHVTHGDGFYKDGSFIQHEDVPYTGSYGVELLRGFSGLIDILNPTHLNVASHSDVSKLYDVIYNGFIPLVYEGVIMDMSRGRAIGRMNSTDRSNGQIVLDCLIVIGNSAPEPHRTNILSRVKQLLLDDIKHLESIVDPIRRNRANTLLNDKSIKPAGRLLLGKEFAAMNRSVYHGENFGFAISKSSNKVDNYELINNENRKGWHTGDGMTYLYNKDSEQFTDYFWGTVDYYRLPGTTADTGTRVSNHAQYGDGEGRPSNSWAGGTTMGDRFGASGMNLIAKRNGGTTLKANKSWFVFDDEIIALGSAINSTDNRNIETTIEQRMINGSNKFIVDKNDRTSELTYKENIKGAKWAYLEGDNEGASIGYYFPVPQDFTALREARTGDYKDIGADSGSFTRNYLTMYFDHGKNPVNGQYSYSILPGKTAPQIQAYSNNPDFKVLQNTNTIHAVKENKLNILAANFFEDGVQTVDILSVDKKASVMVKETKDYLELSISDATLENNGKIIVELNKKVFHALAIDSRITVIEKGDKVKLSVNVANSMGETIKAKFALR